MDEVAIFLELYNDVRPHETIGNLRPIEVHAASHLFRPKCPIILTRYRCPGMASLNSELGAQLPLSTALT